MSLRVFFIALVRNKTDRAGEFSGYSKLLFFVIIKKQVLPRIVESMRVAAKEVGVHIVTGDTKVVEKGAADGIYINTD